MQVSWKPAISRLLAPMALPTKRLVSGELLTLILNDELDEAVEVLLDHR